MTSNLIQSGYLLRLTTGENLVLISQTTFEKLKFKHFSLSIQIWISRQKRLKLQMGVASPFFEPRPSNLVRIHFFLSCKSAEIFVVIFQLVSNLAKISVSVPSIS